MAETLVGAKSKLYIKEKISGYTDTDDTLQHVTAQEISGNRVGLDTVIHGVYRTHTIPKAIEAGSVRRLVKITAHGAKKGDILRFDNGAAEGEEVSIIKIEDADTFFISSEIPGSAIGDLVFIMRHVTPLYDEKGALNVIATPGPSQFVQDGNDVEVEEDTVTMANNKPMPGGMYIKKDDGSWYPVTLDTSNPYAHTPIPVAITDVTGTSNVNVDLSGSSLSVNIKHDGASPSSIRIGDGTTLTSVTSNNELKVKDTDVLAQLNDIETKQDTQITSLLEIEGAVEALEATVALDGGTQPAVGLIVGGHDGSGNFRHIRVNNSGVVKIEQDAQPLPTGAATETTLSALNGKVPANLTVTATRLLVDGSGVTQPISAVSLPLPTGAATEATLATLATEATALNTYNEIVTFGNESNTNQLVQIDLLGSKTETAPASDTASSGLNGRLQRIAQRLTSLIALFPISLGQKTMANSFAVTLASDQSNIPVQQIALTASSDDVTVNNTAGTLTAPAGAKWFKVYASKNNTDDVVIRLGGVATSTVGVIIEPARSEDFMVAGNISHISVSGTQKIHITWGL